MKLSLATLLLAALSTLGTSLALADEATNRDLDRSFQEMKRFHEAEKARMDREAMRDKSHDLRLKVGPNTSLGLDQKGPNIRHTFP